jgi:Xaa-Pro aminopeptidase
MTDRPSRLGRFEAAMSLAEIDAALISVGPDLPYLIGYEAMASERLTMLLVRPQRTPVLFVPLLEAPRVAVEGVDMIAWGETDDPLDLVTRELAAASRVAVGDHTWSVFLMGILQRTEIDDLIPVSILTKDLRMVKDASEIDALRRAGAAVDRVLQRLPREVRFSGRSEVDVARDLMEMTVEEGHREAKFAIVASGPNGASPHHEPTDRVIEAGEVVVCDFGGRLDGYYSDVTRTIAVGDVAPEVENVHQVVLEANRAGRDAVAPGVPCQQVDRAAREVIESAGFAEYFVHRTGHGIGLEVHEHPYMVEGNELPLAEGMTFSVEPGIYLPGRFGVRIEDIVACGDGGVVELNDADRGLVVVE